MKALIVNICNRPRGVYISQINSKFLTQQGVITENNTIYTDWTDINFDEVYINLLLS